MDVERTIEFMLKNQARSDARFNAKFDRADERFRKAEARLDRLEQVVRLNNRVVSRLVRYGVSLRSDLRRTERDIRRLTQAQAETDRALRTFLRSMTHGNRRELSSPTSEDQVPRTRALARRARSWPLRFGLPKVWDKAMRFLQSSGARQRPENKKRFFFRHTLECY